MIMPKCKQLKRKQIGDQHSSQTAVLGYDMKQVFRVFTGIHFEYHQLY